MCWSGTLSETDPLSLIRFRNVLLTERVAKIEEMLG